MWPNKGKGKALFTQQRSVNARKSHVKANIEGGPPACFHVE